MPDSPQTFYVTTPIYYVNARPHIGHAYTTIVADVLARRHRLQGDRVWFLTGTDEHGQKIERSAAAAGIAPQQFADDVSAAFEGLWKRMGITNDQYIRTTSDAHKRGAQKLFAELYQRGRIYLSSYTGQYSIGEEMFVEGPPGTIGPDGKPTETVTEENFFFRLSEYQLRLLDLIESDELKITPEARKNEVLSFLRGNVSAATADDSSSSNKDLLDSSKDLSDSSKDSSPSSKDFSSFAEGGGPASAVSAAGHRYVPGALKDLSVSRSSFTWGIPVPEEIQQAAGAKDKHIIYVWLDALANYITALGYGSDDTSRFDEFWPANVQLVGKEIIRFHCVYWPAFLMAAGLPLPKAVTAHGWLLFEDSKMSKSKGNIVRTETILDAFGTLCPARSAPVDSADTSLLSFRSEAEEGASALPTQQQRDLFAADVLRYFLLREIPFGQDGSFSFDALITRYNADLANGYGNLVSRTLVMIGKYFASVVPSYDRNNFADEVIYDFKSDNTRSVENRNFHNLLGNIALDAAAEKPATNQEFMLDGFLQSLAKLTTHLDGYITARAPWKTYAREELGSKEELSRILYSAADTIRIITALLYPILPYATASVWRQLGLGDIGQAAANGELNNLQWGGLKPGTKLGPLPPIFPRADKKLAETMQAMELDKNVPAATEEASGKKPLSKLVDETTGTTGPKPTDPFDPAAGPRTGTLEEANPGAQVAGSSAVTTERVGTPPHSEAAASGIFAAAPTPPAGPADASPQITIDDFAKVELRVAKVLVCERIPKADKLLRLEVDLGYEQRQILSGIAEWYTPEDLIGRRIVVITNLAPRKMRGLESHGMLLAASAPEGGKPALATFLDTDELPLGSRLK